MKICINCGNKHNFEYKFIDRIGSVYLCKNCDQNESKVEEIDDLLIEIILLLNKNGLETIHCCEGHFNEKLNGSSLGGYITIHDKNKDIYELLNNIPDSIYNFNILYEEINGPKSATDFTFIDKFVLRFEGPKKFEDIYDYTISKVNFYREFGTLLNKILSKKGENQ